MLQHDDWTATGYQLEEARRAATASMDSQSPEEWVDRFGDEPRKGSDIVVQCLEREGAHRIFAYPGGASMEIHQALTRSNVVKNILCRHEQVRLHIGRHMCSLVAHLMACRMIWAQNSTAVHTIAASRCQCRTLSRPCAILAAGPSR